MTDKFNFQNTLDQYDAVGLRARELFLNKQQDYGPSWSILRPASLTDQMYIKAARLRSLEEKGGQQKVEDDIRDDYYGLINYGLMAVIQCRRDKLEQLTDTTLITRLYDESYDDIRELMIRKNHDYGEAWREMRVPSITDLILMKLLRIRSIEDNQGKTLVSESTEAGYCDIVNYAIFAVILLNEKEDQK